MRNSLLKLMSEKQIRENRILNASIVARETGLTPQVVSKWLRGEVVEFRADMVERLCRYFGVPVGDLLYLDPEPTVPMEKA